MRFYPLFRACINLTWLLAVCGVQRKPCPTSSSDKLSVIETAERLIAESQFHAAISCGEQLLGFSVEDSAGYDVIARSCLYLGDFQCCAKSCASIRRIRSHQACNEAHVGTMLLMCGNCWASIESWILAQEAYSMAASCSNLVADTISHAYNNLGNVYRLQKNSEQAIFAYLNASKFSASPADSYFNAGSLLLETGEVERASYLLMQSATSEPSNLENLRAFANSLSILEHPSPEVVEMESRLRQMILRLGDKIDSALALFEIAAFRLKSNLYKEEFAPMIYSAMRRSWYESRHRESIMALVPEIVKRLIQLGSVNLAKFILFRLRDLPSITALDLWTIGTTFASNEMRDYDNSASVLRRAVKMGQKNAIPAFLSALQTTCNWEEMESYLSGMKEELKAIRAATAKSKIKRFLSPYEALYFNFDALEFLHLAQMYASDLNMEAAKLAPSAPFRSLDIHRPVSIAYFSSDFKLSHPIGQLLLPILEAHNKKQVKVFCLDAHPKGINRSNVNWRSEVLRECGSQYIAVGDMRSSKAASLLNQQKLHVIVNLNGWSGEDRNDILLHRPAMLILNALGYAGTSGLRFVDYLLTDRVSTPPDYSSFFTENLLLLPSSHHVLAHKNLFGTRADVRPVPEEYHWLRKDHYEILFACFNRVKKINHRTWDSWMRIMTQANNSLLWLTRLAMSDGTEKNLKSRAMNAGVNESRLIFSTPFSSSDHIFIKGHADVFLDTPNYNAHVTAGDALWAGVSMIVLPLESMASRISSSFSFAISSGILVARNEKDYEDMAVKLSRRKELVTSMKLRLNREKLLSRLFNVVYWVENFERGVKCILELQLGDRTRSNAIVHTR
mmetsp:Transcript_51313/g.160232  ORF Transcript_51313/g.160232 Transcript_51313/m.160232 type:complete len:846 (-) Transcript_51313:374-2911(-)